ncbi:hypothetical protein F4779DRAFT_69386 [Xylariaceae sp. FL0662B]|nr:hypothetical protein F4779DRAFT_69386 [Xylariaceae sp. FL0662B]
MSTFADTNSAFSLVRSGGSSNRSQTFQTGSRDQYTTVCKVSLDSVKVSPGRPFGLLFLCANPRLFRSQKRNAYRMAPRPRTRLRSSNSRPDASSQSTTLRLLASARELLCGLRTSRVASIDAFETVLRVSAGSSKVSLGRPLRSPSTHNRPPSVCELQTCATTRKLFTQTGAPSPRLHTEFEAIPSWFGGPLPLLAPPHASCPRLVCAAPDLSDTLRSLRTARRSRYKSASKLWLVPGRVSQISALCLRSRT